MSTKHQNHQKAVRYYKDLTGNADVDLVEVAAWMIKNGHNAPAPKTPAELLAKELASALREEVRYDKKTGRPYRANHSLPIAEGAGGTYVWFDIDEKPPRKKMHRSLIKRREQMVGDALSLFTDAEHWNNENQTEEPINLPLDFQMDVDIRLNTPDDKAA